VVPPPDADGDGLADALEMVLGTNPNLPDTDSDGLDDGDELALGTDPLTADTDGYGLTYGEEVGFGAAPRIRDTDGDGLSEGVDVQDGLDPHVADMHGSPDLDGVVSVYEPERSPYFNMVEMEGHRARLSKRPEVPVIRRQDAPPVFSVSGSIFAWRRAALDRVTHLYEGVWGAAVVPRENAVDIDTELDFEFVDFLLSKRAGLI